jgi:signal transduction histidine kinase
MDEHARIRELEQELRDLAAALSHDLRAPLRAMDGFSQVLLDQYAPAIDEQGQQYLRFIRDSAADFGRQLAAVVDVLRLGSMDLRPAQVDLGALAAGVVERLRAPEPERVVDVTIAAGLSARGDERLLRVLLESLLSNAWKFTRSSPQARIEVGRTEGHAFFVRDNGVGFDPAYAGRLFQPFGRLHPPAESAGIGMGLARARRVVLRHGGRVWAEGAPERGATFSFTVGELPTSVVP